MSPLRQNCILKCSIKHSSFARCVNFLKKTQDEKMIFAVKNKICLVCIKPKESSVQLPAKSKCQCDMMTSCIRKTNCQKTCFYCQQNHHYIFCKLPPAVTCSESIRKQFLKEVARKEKVNKQNTEKKPENFTFSINFTLSDGKFSMVPKCFIPKS